MQRCMMLLLGADNISFFIPHFYIAWADVSAIGLTSKHPDTKSTRPVLGGD